jgi:hypothetical protein
VLFDLQHAVPYVVKAPHAAGHEPQPASEPPELLPLELIDGRLHNMPFPQHAPFAQLVPAGQVPHGEPLQPHVFVSAAWQTPAPSQHPPEHICEQDVPEDDPLPEDEDDPEELEEAADPDEDPPLDDPLLADDPDELLEPLDPIPDPELDALVPLPELPEPEAPPELGPLLLPDPFPARGGVPPSPT